MESFVLVRHEQHAGDLAGQGDLACIDVAVEVRHSRANAFLVLQDIRERRPIFVTLRHLGVGLGMVHKGDGYVARCEKRLHDIVSGRRRWDRFRAVDAIRSMRAGRTNGEIVRTSKIY